MAIPTFAVTCAECPRLPYSSENTPAAFIDRSSRMWNFPADRVMVRCH
jgi:hypothetical protein